MKMQKLWTKDGIQLCFEHSSCHCDKLSEYLIYDPTSRDESSTVPRVMKKVRGNLHNNEDILLSLSLFVTCYFADCENILWISRTNSVDKWCVMHRTAIIYLIDQNNHNRVSHSLWVLVSYVLNEWTNELTDSIGVKNNEFSNGISMLLFAWDDIWISGRSVYFHLYLSSLHEKWYKL